MAKLVAETKPSILNNSSQVCRLCMSEDSLTDMYKEYSLHQWIEDYLSIMVSVGDRMSKLICTICRTRLTEFHQFRTRCQYVQGVLLSMGQASGKHPNVTDEEQSDLSVQCEVCHKMFKNNKQLFNHRRVHGPKKHKCMHCVKSFARREYLDKHIVSKHVGKSELQQENYSTSDTGHSVEDSKLDQQKPSSVKLGQTGADSSAEAPQDRMEAHTEELEDMIDIEEIKIENRSDSDEETPGDVSNNKSAATATKEKSSNRPFTCDLCAKSFKLKCRLEFHKQYTHGTKQHECPICGRPFGYLHHMQAHMQTHESIQQRQRNDTGKDNSVRSFECDECQKTFKEKKALAHHKRYRHGPKNHECHICGFQFSLACRLAKHMRSHSRKRESKEDFQLS